MGKKKITMERIENPSRRNVTFSKRRQGLFKKASELSMLCNTKIGVLVFSPAGRPYAFGPVDNIFLSYLSQTANGETATDGGVTADPDLSFWWDRIEVQDCHDVQELRRLEEGLEKLKRNIVIRAEKLSREKEWNQFLERILHEANHLEEALTWSDGCFI